MGFFDNTMENAKAAFDAASKKTEKTVAISKKKIEETKLQNRLKSLYASLGERYYVSLKSAEAGSTDFKDLLSAIDEVKKEIKKVRADINALKDKKACPYCGALINSDCEYCGKCGAKCKG